MGSYINDRSRGYGEVAVFKEKWLLPPGIYLHITSNIYYSLPAVIAKRSLHHFIHEHLLPANLKRKRRGRDIFRRLESSGGKRVQVLWCANDSRAGRFLLLAGSAEQDQV
jgi:hypothetical protein